MTRFASDSPRWTVFDEQDELVERIAGQLRPLPEVDAAAKARVLVAVATERERDRERASRRRPRVFGWTVAAGLAATVMFAATARATA